MTAHRRHDILDKLWDLLVSAVFLILLTFLRLRGTGSLRAKARREVKWHISKNPNLNNFELGATSRIANFLFKNRGPVWFLSLYAFLIGVTALTDQFLQERCTSLPQYSFSIRGDFLSTINEINRVFLAVQATLIGVIFPIAIALVSLLLQQRGQTFSSSRVDIYFRESRAFEISASSIMLIIVLVVQQFWPVSALSGTFFSTPHTIFAQIALVIHGFWLALNALAIWRFMKVSFRFISPGGQKDILRRFVAHESVPLDIENQLTRIYLDRPEVFGLLGRNDDPSDVLNKSPSVLFGVFESHTGVVELEKPQNGTYELHDVKFNLIKWVVSRWRKRTMKTWNASKQQNGPKLVFPHKIGRKSFGPVCLCRRAGGSDLTSLEKKVINHAFVFRKVEE